MVLPNVFAFSRLVGEPRAPLLLIGCEPSPPAEEEDFPGSLSEPVRAALHPAAELVLEFARRALRGESVGALAGAVAGTNRRE
jgi:hypothetical protein